MTSYCAIFSNGTIVSCATLNRLRESIRTWNRVESQWAHRLGHRVHVVPLRVAVCEHGADNMVVSERVLPSVFKEVVDIDF